ncbi:MAG: hypothetical protein PHT62_02915 [Desulfotomaculaceae bacterium]|nr:hypothetical protein [Desulfotomaculaceae bacterium]
MTDKKLTILSDLEKLTKEKAENFLSPSIHGQVKIKGKFIRDENGRLVPILVRTTREGTPVQTVRLSVTDLKPPAPERNGRWGGLKKLLGKLFKKRSVCKG